MRHYIGSLTFILGFKNANEISNSLKRAFISSRGPFHLEFLFFFSVIYCYMLVGDVEIVEWVLSEPPNSLHDRLFTSLSFVPILSNCNIRALSFNLILFRHWSQYHSDVRALSELDFVLYLESGHHRCS